MPRKRSTKKTLKKDEPTQGIIETNVIWSNPESEICLFETIEKYPPLGWHLPFSVINASIALNKAGFKITPKEIYEHLKSLYNLDLLKDDAVPLISKSISEFKLPPEFDALKEAYIEKHKMDKPKTKQSKRVEKKKQSSKIEKKQKRKKQRTE